MESFEIRLEYAAPPEQVMRAFWELEDWPAIAPHVRGIDLLYGDGEAQVLIMRVATRDKLDAFKSVRVRQADAIYYFQPTPPVFLRAHHGAWQFVATPTGTTVISRHTVDIDAGAARSFLGQAGIETRDAGDARLQLIGLIRNNSLQTMLALKKRLEQSNGGAHA